MRAAWPPPPAALRWSRVAEPLAALVAARAAEPLGARAGRRRPRSPALRARDAAYIAAKTALNAVGLRDWPRVR